MRVSDPNSHDCRAVSGILARIGDKWSVLIISRLGEGPRRFNEIKRLIGGISQRMLTLTLRNLERDGLVSRTVTPSVPPRVDYALTELGRDLLGPISALGDWAIRHQPCILAARAQFDAAETAQTPQQERVSAG
ncbi:MAG: winged helix-turn-helix transcriptional regulator [Hyphomonadaceae bacterium]